MLYTSKDQGTKSCCVYGLRRTGWEFAGNVTHPHERDEEAERQSIPVVKKGNPEADSQGSNPGLWSLVAV